MCDFDPCPLTIFMKCVHAMFPKKINVLICVTLLFYSAVNGNMNIFPYVSNLESAIYIDLLTCHTKMVENDFETPEKA